MCIGLSAMRRLSIFVSVHITNMSHWNAMESHQIDMFEYLPQKVKRPFTRSKIAALGMQFTRFKMVFALANILHSIWPRSSCKNTFIDFSCCVRGMCVYTEDWFDWHWIMYATWLASIISLWRRERKIQIHMHIVRIPIHSTSNISVEIGNLANFLLFIRLKTENSLHCRIVEKKKFPWKITPVAHRNLIPLCYCIFYAYEEKSLSSTTFHGVNKPANTANFVKQVRGHIYLHPNHGSISYSL